MKTTPKLADGVEFKLGMKIYFPKSMDFAELETDSRFHEINTFSHEGAEYHYLARKGSGMGTDLTHYYSSRNAAIDVEIAKIKLNIRSLEADIAELEAQKDVP